ncbi:DNA cytosine methyltransferase [Hyphococcus sp.]|uniref:DNA cytosine methyltransferase n=1 Tax=Hyphococcus sp. TaxID=2038636 RepID=UPI003CCBFACE
MVRKASRPKVLDLFAGAGGLSLGFEQAGFDVSAAVELDPVHAAVHKFNFPECEIFPVSISELSGSEILKRMGLAKGEIDVVCGGAPCQGFSLIGQRALDDPRNSLVKEFVRIVDELKPSYFLFENVKGLTVGKHKKFLDEIIGAFEQIGYTVQMPWRVLNAVEFGVPQDRQRLILIGALKGKKLPAYPKPITRAAGSTGKELPEGPTCYDALADLPDAESFAALCNVDEVQTRQWGKPSSYARRLRCLENDSWAFGHPREWNPTTLTSSSRTDHTEISRRRFVETEPGSVEPVSRFFKLAKSGVSNTLRAGTDSARGAFTSPRPIHYRFARCVTVREMARLHSFPDWFRFHETKWHGARQIGNSVPPFLARAVASEIAAAMGYKPRTSERSVALGDTALLRMSVAEAATFWGVDNPIGQRNKKSGAKKRKQADIEAERLAVL